MGSWTPQDWAMFMTAVGTLITALLAAVAAFLANLAKIRSEANAEKIDHNTEVTKAGTEAATKNAEKATIAATDAKKTGTVIVETIKAKLNGGIDAAIQSAMEPFTAKLCGIEKEMDRRWVIIEQLQKSQLHSEMVESLQEIGDRITRHAENNEQSRVAILKAIEELKARK